MLTVEAVYPVELPVDDLLEGVDVGAVVIERGQVAIHGVLGSGGQDQVGVHLLAIVALGPVHDKAVLDGAGQGLVVLLAPPLPLGQRGLDRLDEASLRIAFNLGYGLGIGRDHHGEAVGVGIAGAVLAVVARDMVVAVLVLGWAVLMLFLHAPGRIAEA